MFEVDLCGVNEGQVLLRVVTPRFNTDCAKTAKEIALLNGYNPSTIGRMTEASRNKRFYTFTMDGIRTLFNGKKYYKIYSTLDANGNKVAKVFYMNGTAEVIKDARLPHFTDKVYKSLSGLKNSK